MSKGPTPRHSKPPKPVTIDLDATDVTPKAEPAKPKSSATGPAVARTPDPVEPDKAEGKTAASASAASATGGDSASKSGPATKPEAKAETKPAETRTPETKSDTATASGPTKAPDSSKTPDSGKGAEQKDTKTTSAAAKSESSGSAGSTNARPAAAAPAKSGGGIGMVMSGLIGAVIALGGGYALQAGGLLPTPGAGGDQVAPVTSRVEALSTEVEALKQQVSDSAAQSGSAVPADLSARLDSLEHTLGELGSGDGSMNAAALSELESRLSGLENRITELAQAAPTAGADPELAAQLNELRAAQSGLQSSIAELRSGTDAINGKISELEQGQQELSAQVDAPSRQIDLARAIAAAGLKSAIDRGGPFMSELEAFASVVPDDPAVPELRDLAARGVPSRAELVAGFSDAASKAIAAADPGNPEAGLVDRLMSSALSVVKVRKVGDVPGDSAEAIVARAETRLVNGDLDAALAEWNTLPEASLAATADYGEALAARARSEKLIAAAMTPSSASAAPAN